MSSTIAFPHVCLNGNGYTYYTFGSACNVGAAGDNKVYHINMGSSASNSKATANATTKSELFPNGTAHPTKCDLKYGTNITGVTGNNVKVIFYVGGTAIHTTTRPTGGGEYTANGITASALTSATKDTSIQWGLEVGPALAAVGIRDIHVTFYFNCYDFSATAGTGVTSASVSSSTGYDGATVTFSCVIPTGYVFDGWYSGSTLVSSLQSYPHTVNGADLTLTAKAHQQTHNVNGTYNGSTKAILTGVTGDVTVSYNGRSKTLNSSSASHTLSCANKAMRGNVSVGSASLATAEKIMRSNLVLNYV